MAKNIEIKDLANEITKQLSEYTDDVKIITDEETEKMAKQLVEDLKNDDSIPQRTKGQKAYKKQFFMRKFGSWCTQRGFHIANHKWQLTHLLENGHATPNGGRTRAFPHWAKANKKAQDLAINIRKRLEDISK